MNFHPYGKPEQTLKWPVTLGHFLPWYTVRGSDYPLAADDAEGMDVMPDIEDMRHWEDRRAGYRRTHLQMPEIGVYDSRDPELIDWQIARAVEYGIAGFIVNWYGKNSVENVITLHWLNGLERWNREHPESPFCYFISYDMQAQFPSEGKQPVSLNEDLAYIRDRLLRDGYLCRDGRPLFSIFPYGDIRGEFREALDDVFADSGADLIWGGDADSGHEDAVYAWVKPDRETIEPEPPYNWKDPGNCGEAELGRFLAAANEAGPRCAYAMHGVWPGFDSELVAWAWSENPDDPKIRPRVICRETGTGSALERTWAVYLDYLRRQAAGDPGAKLPAPLVQLVTWNDYAETTTLEPTRDHGRAPLELCRDHIAAARRILRGED